MKRLTAVITVELVDESATEKTSALQKEILEWFEENCNFIPWVKQVKNVVVKEE